VVGVPTGLVSFKIVSVPVIAKCISDFCLKPGEYFAVMVNDNVATRCPYCGGKGKYARSAESLDGETDETHKSCG
jgi:hypothetical protein